MESYLLEWANLLLRWLHVITAIAWIGSSFYFVFLDSSLEVPKDEALRKEGATGELWAVHGGGFYHPVKYAVRPPFLAPRLHWFYWESYATWLSGFALLCVSYLYSAQIYLIDANRFAWWGKPWAAVLGALALFVFFWLAYDAVCRIFGHVKDSQGRVTGVGNDGVVAAWIAGLVVVMAYVACALFAPRAAFLLVGAALATSMSANVLMWIIPGQRKVVRAIQTGAPVEAIHGQRGKQRSVHNTYFTLPVVFAMLSNHYSFVYSHAQAWVVLVAMMFAGAAIRQFFVLRHGYHLGRNAHPWPYAAVGVALLLVLIVAMRPAPPSAVVATKDVAASADKQGAAAANDQKFDLAALQAVLQSRCIQCHNAQVQMKNVRLDTPDELKRHAQAVYNQVVVTKQMPMNNSTGITEAERALVADWFKAGAPVR